MTERRVELDIWDNSYHSNPNLLATSRIFSFDNPSNPGNGDGLGGFTSQQVGPGFGGIVSCNEKNFGQPCWITNKFYCQPLNPTFLFSSIIYVVLFINHNTFWFSMFKM